LPRYLPLADTCYQVSPLGLLGDLAAPCIYFES
jgi:hypothetical protein